MAKLQMSGSYFLKTPLAGTLAQLRFEEERRRLSRDARNYTEDSLSRSSQLPLAPEYTRNSCSGSKRVNLLLETCVFRRRDRIRPGRDALALRESRTARIWANSSASHLVP